MCNRARNRAEPETLFERFGGGWLTEKPRDSRFNPTELYPKTRAYVVRRPPRRRAPAQGIQPH